MNVGRRTLYVAEPPAQYLVRVPAVVDCSVLSAVLFDEAERGEAEQLMTDKQLCAPRVLDNEVTNVAAVKVRRGMALADAQAALADYGSYLISIADPDRARQLELAARYALSAYDAAYLWLAGELRAPLLTFDKKLADAARQHLQSLG